MWSIGTASSPTATAISDGVGCSGMVIARSSRPLHPATIVAASALISGGATVARSGGTARRRARMTSLRSAEFAPPTPDLPTSPRLPERLFQRVQKTGFGGPGAVVVDAGVTETGLVPR